MNKLSRHYYNQNPNEACVYKKNIDNKVVFLMKYMDDILFIGNDIGESTSTKHWLTQQSDIKDLREANWVLGIQILRDWKNRRIALSQASYIDKIQTKFAMQDSKKCQTPFRHGIHLLQEQSPKTPSEVEYMK